MQFKTQIPVTDIQFPYQPYKLQQSMMRKILIAIQSKRPCLMESPTGTGKTLCLLSACLEAVKQRKAKKIYYLTRTHSQMDCIVKQIQQSKYEPIFSVQQSKKGLCGNPEVVKYGKSMEHQQFQALCHYAKSTKIDSEDRVVSHCELQTQFRKKQDQDRQQADIDILVKTHYDFKKRKNIKQIKQYSAEHGLCPYYVESNLSKRAAKLIIMSYKYICDKFLYAMKSLNQQIKDCIILFDEAHNIIDIAKEEESFSIRKSLVPNTLMEISRMRHFIQQKMNKQNNQEEQKQLVGIGCILDKFEKYCKNIQLLTEQLKKKYYCRKTQKFAILDISEIKKQIQDTGLHQYSDFFYQNIKLFFKLEDVTKEMANESIKSEDDKKQRFMRSNKKSSIIQFSKFCFYLSSLLFNNNVDSFYKCVLSKQHKYQKDHIKIEFRCLTSRLMFERIQKAGIASILFASGTLKPFEQFQDTGLKIHKSLEFEPKYPEESILKDHNVKTFFVRSYQHKELILSSKNPQVSEVSDILSQIFEVVPYGIIAFFKSSNAMNKYRTYFYQNGLSFNRPIFWQSSNKKQFERDIKNYKIKASTAPGAILMAVFRGKISEGYNFKDNLCRAVILVGIPYQNLDSLRCHLERRVNLNKFNRWYLADAMIAANQAIGRLIRNKNDFGAVYLVGTQYYRERIWISNWVLDGGYEANMPIQSIKEATKKYFQAKRAEGKLIETKVEDSETDSSEENEKENDQNFQRRGNIKNEDNSIENQQNKMEFFAISELKQQFMEIQKVQQKELQQRGQQQQDEQSEDLLSLISARQRTLNRVQENHNT